MSEVEVESSIPLIPTKRRHCPACGKLLRRPGYIGDGHPRGIRGSISDARKLLKPSDTADLCVPEFGNLADNLTCGLACGYALMIKLVQAIGVDDALGMLAAVADPKVVQPRERYASGAELLRSIDYLTKAYVSDARPTFAEAGKGQCGCCRRRRKLTAWNYPRTTQRWLLAANPLNSTNSPNATELVRRAAVCDSCLSLIKQKIEVADAE